MVGCESTKVVGRVKKPGFAKRERLGRQGIKVLRPSLDGRDKTKRRHQNVVAIELGCDNFGIEEVLVPTPSYEL